jgi:DNA uptake protein ComE-like DNA-binding protein
VRAARQCARPCSTVGGRRIDLYKSKSTTRTVGTFLPADGLDEKDSRFRKLVRRSPQDEQAGRAPHQRGQRRKGETTGIDLNTATEEELDALWGVGPQTARKIVEFRQREGHIVSGSARAPLTAA